MKTLGIVVLALGIIMTIFTGFNLVTKEKVVDIAPLIATCDFRFLTPISK